MKIYLTYSIGALIFLCLVFVVMLFLKSSPIGDTMRVAQFMNSNEPNGKVLLQIPFIKNIDEGAVLSVAVDLNRDNAFDKSEMLVENYPTPARAAWSAGFYAVAPNIASDMVAEITVNGKAYKATTHVSTHDIGSLLALTNTTDPENAMKGWGASVVYAEDMEAIKENVPDLDQRPAECAPTAAANSLIDLVNRNGGEDLIAGDPNDFIENLKRHMNWTPENGVLPPDFVAGKNRWAAAAGVPIRTTLVGDTHGTSTLPAIKAALQRGDAVEIRIKFIHPNGRRVIGGHMVTVIGVQEQNGVTYLYINDPATPGGVTEVVEMKANELTNYGGYTDGKTLLSWGFVQTWEGYPTGELLDTMTDAEIQGIQQFAGDTPQLTVIKYGNDHIQVSQLRVGDHAEGCGEKHWHADKPVTTVKGKTVNDPDPSGCGFGTVKENPSINIPAPDRSP